MVEKQIVKNFKSLNVTLIILMQIKITYLKYIFICMFSIILLYASGALTDIKETQPIIPKLVSEQADYPPRFKPD